VSDGFPDPSARAMKHLTADELVDRLEGTLAAGRAAHLEACAACRAQAEALRAVLRDVDALDVPEPSPLFWDHFSARVRRAIDAAPPPASGWWQGWSRASLAAAGVAAALLLVLAGAVMRPGSGPAQETSADDLVEPVTLSPEAELEWALMVDLTRGLDLDEAGDAGLTMRPGAAERAIMQLTAEERRELARLLDEALERSKS
jgi:hypothetical protein